MRESQSHTKVRVCVVGSRRYAAFCLLALLVVWVCCSVAPAAAQNRQCERIVSLAPSITEALFALGLGGNVVGVTTFCRYPPEAQRVPKVGGFYGVGVEAIYQLKPSMVFALSEGIDLSKVSKQLGFVSLQLEHRSLAGIRESLTRIGEACGVEQAATALLGKLRAEEQELRSKTEGVPRYRVLVVVGRSHEGSRASGLYVSGRDGFYSDILDLVGAENVNQKTTMSVPVVSPEGILSLNPDVVIEIVNVDDEPALQRVDEFWAAYPQITAVKQKRVFALTEDFASIPSVRYLQLARSVAELLYPERFVKKPTQGGS